MAEGDRAVFGELGATGLRRFGGILDEEWLRLLQGGKSTAVWKEMRDNDPVVGAVLFAIEMLIRQVEWRVEAASDDQADLEAAEFLQSNLDDMEHTWSDTLASILEMLPFGWSLHEQVLKRRIGDVRDPTQRSRFTDGRIGWRKLPIRAQDTLQNWQFDESGEVEAMVQSPPPDFQTRVIPLEKSLLFRTTVKKNNPEGRSILRNAFRPWFFKRRIEEIEAIGVERDLAGLPMALVPSRIMHPNASATDKALRTEIEKIVRNVKRDEKEGLVFPSDRDPETGNPVYEFKLLSTGGRRQLDVDQIVKRYDSRIAMSALADFILLGHEKVGSFALSSSKTNIFGTAVGAWLDSIADTFNRKAIPPLFAVNDFRVGRLPMLAHGDIETVDLEELGKIITAASGAGASLFPDPEFENWMRRQMGAPEISEEEG